MADIRIKDLAVTASASSSDDYLAVDGSTNGTRKLSAYSPTFGGNLTVSGTGTIGSNLTVNGSTISLPSTSGNVDLFGRLFALNVTNETRLYAGSSGISLYDHIGSGRLAQFTQSLITIDKDATFAGSVSIGNSDTTLSRAAAQTLQLNTSSTPQFSLSVNGTQKARFESYTDDLYISTLTAGKSILLRSGNAATALTLDSSQNATFAGQVNILDSNSYIKADSSNLVYETYAGKGHQFKTGGTTALTLDSSQNATFAGDVTINKSTPLYGLAVSGSRKGFLYFDGTNTILGTDTGSVVLSSNSGNVVINNGQAIQLGNAYVAGAPTATGYVTIKDSSGTTYKVLVST